jgi:hypothetical protein
VGNWLTGGVFHVGGLVGRTDTRVVVRGASGDLLQVVQDGSGAQVTDQTTGEVSRIDPAPLGVGQAHDFRTSGAQVIAGPGATYVVAPKQGTVQRVDPASLADVGSPIGLTGPLGRAALDGRGTLWVPVPARGHVVPVSQGKQGPPVAVGALNDQLELIIAGGTPVVVDGAAATLTVVDPAGIVRTVSLRSSVNRSVGLLTPASADGSLVPVVSRSPHRVLLVDTATGSVSPSASLNATGELGAPQLIGNRVYVPDQTTGQLIVYDTRSGRLDKRIAVTGKPGQLEASLRDGRLWVNDQNSAAALVVDADGTTHALGTAVRATSGTASPAARARTG